MILQISLNKDYLSNKSSSAMSLEPTDREDIANTISFLNSKKDPGPNSIPIEYYFFLKK